MGPRKELEKMEKSGLSGDICEAIRTFWGHMKPPDEYEPDWFNAFVAVWTAEGRISMDNMLLSSTIYTFLYSPVN